MQKIFFCERYMLTTAVRNRTKEMTRRLEKPLECAVTEYENDYGEAFEIISQKWDNVTSSLSVFTPHGMIKLDTQYKLNELVAVAQNYNDAAKEAEFYTHDETLSLILLSKQREKGWTNKLYVKPGLMPLQIKIIGIGIERLQDISEEDCLKEGVICETFDDGTPLCYKVVGVHVRKGLLLKEFTTPRQAFAALINSPGVGRKGLWESNPFVVVYEFKLVSKSLVTTLKHQSYESI